jgi:protein disulfide-isomerase A4
MQKKEPNLIVAKFNATENKLLPEKYQIEEFPTLYFAPSGRKNEPIKYTGNRNLKELRNFLKQNAVKSFR